MFVAALHNVDKNESDVAGVVLVLGDALFERRPFLRQQQVIETPLHHARAFVELKHPSHILGDTNRELLQVSWNTNTRPSADSSHANMTSGPDEMSKRSLILEKSVR